VVIRIRFTGAVGLYLNHTPRELLGSMIPLAVVFTILLFTVEASTISPSRSGNALSQAAVSMFVEVGLAVKLTQPLVGIVDDSSDAVGDSPTWFLVKLSSSFDLFKF
jgi:hypothetical protein